MSDIKQVKMPDGTMLQTITIVSEAQLKSHLPKFWSEAIPNPMVAFDTEWASDPCTRRTKISILALCNLNNTCLIIHFKRFISMSIPCILIDFFAAKYIRFVGVNISKELQKLKEDCGIEIRTSIDLSQVASNCWDKLGNHSPSEPYEVWKDYTLIFTNLYSKKIPLPLCGVQLLSALVANMKIPYVTPSVVDVLPLYPPSLHESSGLMDCPDIELLTFHVYAALKIGIKLLQAKRKKRFFFW